MASEVFSAREGKINPINAVRDGGKRMDEGALRKGFATVQSLTSRNKHLEADRALSKMLGFDDYVSKYDELIRKVKQNPRNETVARNRANDMFGDVLKRIRAEYDKETRQKIMERINKL